MDLFCTDKKLSELGGQDFEDLLDQDVFTPPPSNSSLEHFGVDPTMDQDWLENFFEDPVLNDRMISDALQPPQHVQSEHSYSLSNSEQVAEFGLPMLIKTEPLDKDNDPELLGTVNPNMTMTRRSNEALPTMKTENAQAMDMSSLKPTPHPIINQPTIILATSTANTVTSPVQKGPETLVIPNVNIKVEPMEIVSQKSNFNLSPQPTSNYGLPPTPPCSSSSSDSEGGSSPRRSAPPSPIHHSPVTSQHHHDTFRSVPQPLFTSPIPTSGVLILSEEEKRTLISEGYPIPGKLPLTKQEEKNLKKIRRKIKNKISAQESRRKKKEYLETLEKRMEVYSQENTDLRKKVDNLENNNRSLLSQLQKLQGLVAKVARPSSATSTQTGTCLMVLVLCFAVFLGTWSPMNWSLGYRSVTGMPSPAYNPPVVKVPLPNGPPMGPEIKNPIVDAYLTPSKRSRVLLSVREDSEDEAPYGPHTPLQYNYKNIFMHWFSSAPAGGEDTVCDEVVQLQPELPKVQVLDVETENNQTGEDRVHYDQGNMHPDIAADLVGNNPTNAVA